MTFSPLPTDPSDLYAMMGADALLAHIEAATAMLERLGVEITADARCGLDELAECVVEHHARTDPVALQRHLEKTERATEPAPAGFAS